MIKTAAEVALLRESGAILAASMETVLAAVRPGITTDELDQIFVESLKGTGAKPSFLGYRGYPKSICTSVNNEVVHGIPGGRVLEEGDIIGVDCGVRHKNYCTDMARKVAVGVIDEERQKLLDVTQEALKLGIAQLVPGNRIGDVGHAVQEYVEQFGYSVVRVLVGHGVGTSVHEEPSVPNYGKAGTGMKIEEGLVVAVEPMVNIGGAEVDFSDDGWTVTTTDGTLSAHFEDTIAVTADGPEILTTT